MKARYILIPIAIAAPFLCWLLYNVNYDTAVKTKSVEGLGIVCLVTTMLICVACIAFTAFEIAKEDRARNP